MKGITGMYDVVIIGAGVVGGFIARELSRYKLNICLLEKENDVAMGASRANSGIVHAGFDALTGTKKAEFNVLGAKIMKRVTDELGVKYKNNGSLVVAYSEEELPTLQKLYERGVANGVENLQIIDKAKLLELEPNLTDSAVAALYAPTAGIVCPYELTIAAVGNAMDNGAELKLDFDVKSIRRNGDFYEISSENETVEGKYLVNAAGVHSDNIAALIGDTSFNVTARKGEYLLLDKEFGTMASHTIFRCPTSMGKGILVSPTVDGNLILGPTSVNIDDKDNNETTPEGLSEIMSKTLAVMPKAPLRSVITSFCGVRAVPSTGDFIIEKAADGFVNCAGIESPGLSSAPAIAPYVVELLKGMGLSLEENESFNPIRKPAHLFREMSMEDKNKVIAENPKYGKVVCRCETVTEGEIVEAIHTNPKATSVDAIKRRTRSGMGRCQGGFCAPTVVEILARELDIPFEAVTKSGGNSIINYGRIK